MLLSGVNGFFASDGFFFFGHRGVVRFAEGLVRWGWERGVSSVGHALCWTFLDRSRSCSGGGMTGFLSRFLRDPPARNLCKPYDPPQGRARVSRYPRGRSRQGKGRLELWTARLLETGTTGQAVPKQGCCLVTWLPLLSLLLLLPSPYLFSCVVYFFPSWA